MSVRIVDGIGRDVNCTLCNSPLILSSKTGYKRCEKCGIEYNLYQCNIDNIKPIPDGITLTHLASGFVAIYKSINAKD